MEQGNPSGAIDNPLIDFDAICQRARAAIDSTRVHAVALLDDNGDVLWLTESSMGPDEHNAVRAAFDAFAAPNGHPIVSYDLGDARSAVLFRAVDSRRTLIGALMAVMDTRAVPQDSRGLTRLMNPKLQQVMSDFAGMRPSTAPPARSTPAVQPHKPPRPVTPEMDRLHAALRRSPIALFVQPLMPLTSAAELRRYEVLLRSGAETAPNVAPQAMLKAAVEHGLGSMIDRRVLTQLLGWLVRNPAVWRDSAAQFSVNLTKTALHDEHFIQFVGLCLAKAALPKSMIAFEIDVPTALSLGPRMTATAAAIHRLECPLVLDDFGMRTECFDLLRLPGVRYIKMSSVMTVKMRSDKLSQAAITAVVQMARVLGMHTVAKHTESAAEQEWLTALGVDFVQSNSLAPPAPIESLLKSVKVAANQGRRPTP